MKKINTNKSITVIESSDTNKIKIHLQNRPVNPVKLWTGKTESLVNKFVSLKRNQVVYNRGKSIDVYKGKKYPIIYSPSKTLYTKNEELAAGLGKKKAVIFAISTDYSFKMDFTGNMGAGPNTFYIPFQTVSEGKRLEHFLKGEDYKLLVSSTKTNRKYLKIALIEYLKLDKIMHNSTKKTKKRKHNNNAKTKKM